METRVILLQQASTDLRRFLDTAILNPLVSYAPTEKEIPKALENIYAAPYVQVGRYVLAWAPAYVTVLSPTTRIDINVMMKIKEETLCLCFLMKSAILPVEVTPQWDYPLGPVSRDLTRFFANMCENASYSISPVPHSFALLQDSTMFHCREHSDGSIWYSSETPTQGARHGPLDPGQNLPRSITRRSLNDSPHDTRNLNRRSPTCSPNDARTLRGEATQFTHDFLRAGSCPTLQTRELPKGSCPDPASRPMSATPSNPDMTPLIKAMDVIHQDLGKIHECLSSNTKPPGLPAHPHMCDAVEILKGMVAEFEDFHLRPPPDEDQQKSPAHQSLLEQKLKESEDRLQQVLREVKEQREHLAELTQTSTVQLESKSREITDLTDQLKRQRSQTDTATPLMFTGITAALDFSMLPTLQSPICSVSALLAIISPFYNGLLRLASPAFMQGDLFNQFLMDIKEQTSRAALLLEEKKASLGQEAQKRVTSLHKARTEFLQLDYAGLVSATTATKGGTCFFCQLQFSNAQGLGGHTNHRAHTATQLTHSHLNLIARCYFITALTRPSPLADWNTLLTSKDTTSESVAQLMKFNQRALTLLDVLRPWGLLDACHITTLLDKWIPAFNLDVTEHQLTQMHDELAVVEPILGSSSIMTLVNPEIESILRPVWSQLRGLLHPTTELPWMTGDDSVFEEHNPV